MRFNCNKTVLVLSTIGLFAASLANATTTVSTFDFTSSSNFSNTSIGDGNVYEISQGGLNLDITAYADTGNNGEVETAEVSSNNHGLLVYNQDNNDGHYVDNSDQRDMLLFDFNKSVALTQLNIGYSSNDSDMVVIGFNTLPSYSSSSTWSSIASAITAGTHAVFEIINHGATSGWESFNNGGFESQYWLVGAYNKYFGSTSGYENGKDYVKIAGIMTSHEDSNTTPPVEANAPASLGLMAAALVFMWNRRRIHK